MPNRDPTPNFRFPQSGPAYQARTRRVDRLIGALCIIGLLAFTAWDMWVKLHS